MRYSDVVISVYKMLYTSLLLVNIYRNALDCTRIQTHTHQSLERYALISYILF